MQLQETYEDFLALDTVAIAVFQEDTELVEANYRPFLARFDPLPLFDLVVDVNRAATAAYERTTTYLVDRDGIVRQIFPTIIHARPSWKAILPSVERLNASGG